MGVILGVIFHFIGGFASGSFYMPYKKVKGWSWESYWIVGGIFSWLFVPPIAAWLTIPNFSEIIAQSSTSTIVYTYIFGLLWGIGGLTYGLGVRYLGVSLGSSIILGLCMVFGALIPSIYYEIFPAEGKDTIGMITSSTWGLTVLAGLAICIIGIILCGKAGTMKEKQLKANRPDDDGNGSTVRLRKLAPVKEEASVGAGTTHPAYEEVVLSKVEASAHGPSSSSIAEYKFGLGLFVSIVSGVLSACFNFGLEAGKTMADTANTIWTTSNPGEGEFLFRNNVIYVVILWGGLTTNLIWCLILNARNKTFSDYTNSKTPILKNILLCALAGTTWFLQFFFYGMGESKLGNGASSWILHMSFIILVANMWGLISKEWHGVSKNTRTTIIAGVLTIIVAVLVVGYGNYLKP
ncbi:MAG: L-rhamnose/proton symporter RhaT [Gammaproteobacteria bacterium]|nr:L-rhamnose/proton symporter RhaT [Gammaproteobacteria bacterium]